MMRQVLLVWPDMTRLVLVMLEPLGTSFAECAQHVLGHKADLTVFDVAPDADPDKQVDQLTAILQQAPEQSALVLCDIFGATPFNIAQRAIKLAAEQGVSTHLLTGANLCMVLKALTEQQENASQLSQNAQLSALRGIVNADHANAGTDCKC